MPTLLMNTPSVISARLSRASLGRRSNQGAEYRHAGTRHREQMRRAAPAVGTAEARDRNTDPFEPERGCRQRAFAATRHPEYRLDAARPDEMVDVPVGAFRPPQMAAHAGADAS